MSQEIKPHKPSVEMAVARIAARPAHLTGRLHWDPKFVRMVRQKPLDGAKKAT